MPATLELDGEHTNATVMIDEVEENCLDQIQSMIDHEAFENDVVVMPDTHWGMGAVIGFTMPLGDRVIPNVIGVDIGCGLDAMNLGPDLPIRGEELDEAVRARVPMGYGPDGLRAPERDHYHVKNDFPWAETNETLAGFVDAMDEAYVEPMEQFLADGGYDIDYFKELVTERAGRMSGYFGLNEAIASVGTLGAGNHFVEIGRSVETGDYWVVVHSGSRGLGANTAQYWQERASHLRRVEGARETLRSFPEAYREYVKFDLDAVSDEDLLDWLQGSKGESFVDYEALNADFADSEPSKIEEIGKELKTAIPDGASDGEPLDYLQGEEAAGYLVDMIFCQRYAAESRRVMAEAVADVLGVETTDHVRSTHNFIDFRDAIIRKGATRAYEGERVIVPFDMAHGTLICEGKSNPDWNYSSPHGAGRVMSRTEAKEVLDEDEVREQMDGIHTSVVPLDEAPDAYKDPAVIEAAIEPTAEVVDRLEVVHNFKAT